MLSAWQLPVRALLNKLTSLASGTAAQAAEIVSSAISHHNITSKYRFGKCSPLEDLYPLRFLESQVHISKFSNCTQEDYVGLGITFLITALAFLAVLYIGRTLDRPIHPDLTRLHILERAITQQIKFNYRLSRPSQNHGLGLFNNDMDGFEQWALCWAEIQSYREQAEADFQQGLPKWYYDHQPDMEEREHELRNEFVRLHNLERNIVTAKDRALQYCVGATENGETKVIDGERWTEWEISALNLEPC